MFVPTISSRLAFFGHSFCFLVTEEEISMKSISRTLVFTLAMLMVVQPMLSWAGTGARVIPQGKVSLLEEGKEATQFQSELPLPEGTLMLCNGNCLVQTQNLQLVAQDRAVFALAEGKARWDLTVKSGQVDFAMRADAKPISFHTPNDTIQMERAIVPASGAGMVRGSIKVSETESVLSMQEGALQVMSPDGTVLIQPGQGIRLAAAPATTGATAGVAGSGETLYGGLTVTTWALIGLGVAAAIAIPVALSSGGGGDERPVSGQ
jgi:hypothetical protein